MSTKSFSRGFTLMELLAVIALIGVLVGVGIPTFNSALEKSRKESCDAKCLALENEANATIMTTVNEPLPPADNDPLDDHLANRPIEGDSAADLAAEALSALPDDYRTICPSGGDIAIYPDLSGKIHLVCSIHGTGQMQYFDPVASITTGFQVLKNNGEDIASKIDSTSGNGPNINAMFPYLPSFGSHNIATWSVKNNYVNGNKKTGYMEYIVWSDVDIRNVKTGTVVPVMRYNVESDTYEVWNMEVAVSKDNNETYNVLDHSNLSEYKDSAEADVSKLTFDQALEWYDKAKKEYKTKYPS